MDNFHKINKNLFTKCFMCNGFVSSLLYGAHLIAIHRISPIRVAGCFMPMGLRHDEMPLLATDYGSHTCDLCEVKVPFPTMTRLREHVKKVHPKDCTRHSCWLCAASYKRQASLVRHLYSQHEHLCWRCNYCNEPFRFKSSLKSHLVDEHGDPQSKHCYSCNFTFANGQEYGKHVDKAHSGKGYVKCMYCSLEFDDYTIYSGHACRLNTT